MHTNLIASNRYKSSNISIESHENIVLIHKFTCYRSLVSITENVQYTFDIETFLPITNRNLRISISVNSSCSFTQAERDRERMLCGKKITSIEQIDLYFD